MLGWCKSNSGADFTLLEGDPWPSIWRYAVGTPWDQFPMGGFKPHNLFHLNLWGIRFPAVCPIVTITIKKGYMRGQKVLGFMKKRHQSTYQAQEWFQDLDAESQQDTAISYLRRLPAKDYKNFLAAMELYRQADIVIGRVKEVDVKTNEDLPVLSQHDNRAKSEEKKEDD